MQYNTGYELIVGLIAITLLTGLGIWQLQQETIYYVGMGIVAFFLLLFLLLQGDHSPQSRTRTIASVHSGQIDPEAITVSHLSQDVLDLISASGGGVAYQTFLLSAEDVSNKYVDLSVVPTKVHLTVSDGLDQQYGEDFAIVSDGIENKRLTWDGDNPNVSIGLVSSLSISDELQVLMIL